MTAYGQATINDSIYKNELDNNKYNQIMILLFPFATFIGPHINFGGLNFSNIYSVFLLFLTLRSLLMNKYQNILGYIIFFFMLFSYAMLTIIWTEHVNLGLSLLFPLGTSLIAMAYISSFNQKELNLFLHAFSLFTLIVLSMSVIEIFTGNYLVFNNLDFIYKTNMYNQHFPGAFFTNPNDLSQFLLIGVPLLMFMYYYKRKKIILPLLLFLITTYVMLNSMSRLSLMAFIIITLTHFLLIILQEGKRSLKLILTFLLFILIVMMSPLLGFNLLEYVSQYSIFETFLQVDASQDYYLSRELIYNNVLEVGIDNIIIGAGLGSSYFASIGGPHNMFLFIFADLGIAFSIGFIVVLITLFLTLFKSKNIIVCGYNLNAILLSMLVVFPIFSSISSGNEQRKIVWVFLGLTFAVINNVRRKSFNNNFGDKVESKR